MKIETIQNTYIEAEIVLPDRIVKNKEDVQLRCVLDSKLGPVYLTEKLTVDEDKSTLNDTYCRWEYDLEDKYILPGTYSFEIVIVQSSGKVIPISHKAENCLVIVPAERGDAYPLALLQKINKMFSEGLPIKNGGTDATDAAGARQNLCYLGRNPVTLDTDTPIVWSGFGTGFAYISGFGHVADQPSENGFLGNFVTDKGGVWHIWHSHMSGGATYMREGNSSGWFSASWTKIFDSNDVAGTRQKLNYLGKNPVTADTDTPSAWIALGSGTAYISAYGYITDQPAEFGFIDNDVSDTGVVKQIWHTQSGKGTIFKRAGTINGWYATSWTEVFDSKSYIPTQNGGVGANTSVDMGEAEHLECVNRFVAEMNRVASRIGMSNSTFKTPSGNCSNPINKANAPVNTDYNSYTTAFDMMRLLAAVRHSPSVFAAMGTPKYDYKKNGGNYSETHGILGMSGWYGWADNNGYTLLAAKGGSLTGSYGQIGTKGILNYAMLIKAPVNNQERIFGITIVGLTLTTDGYLTAQRVIKGLIDKFSGADDTAEIKDMTKKLVEGKEEEGGREYPVGLMITDFTTSTNFEEDIQRIAGAKEGYRYHYNKDTVRAAASLTKILNAIVVASHLDNHYITVNNDDFVAGADAAKVAIGDVVTTYDALNVMMLRSCNAYATMLARDTGKRLPPAVT